MIPQLKERIAKLENALTDQDQQLRSLGENLAELREQLQVERQPQIKLSEPPMMDYPCASKEARYR